MSVETTSILMHNIDTLRERIEKMQMTWEKLMQNELVGASVINNLGFKLVVLDKGFLYVGGLSIDGSNTWVYLKEAWNVRYWGTSRGMGQLRKGPTSKTQIDPVGNIQVPFGTLLQIIDTDKVRWNELFESTLAGIAKEE